MGMFDSVYVTCLLEKNENIKNSRKFIYVIKSRCIIICM